MIRRLCRGCTQTPALPSQIWKANRIAQTTFPFTQSHPGQILSKDCNPNWRPLKIGQRAFYPLHPDDFSLTPQSDTLDLKRFPVCFDWSPPQRGGLSSPLHPASSQHGAEGSQVMVWAVALFSSHPASHRHRNANVVLPRQLLHALGLTE